MGRLGDRSYLFDTPAHWRAGAMTGLAISGGGLAASPPLAAHRIWDPPADALVTLDACGRLVWFDRRTHELFVVQVFGAELQGRIAVDGAEALHAGPSILWVRSRNRLHRFSAHGLQELGTVAIEGLVASVSDGADGLWVVVHDSSGARAIWLDAYGQSPQPPISLPEAQTPLAIVSDRARQRLAILDAEDGATVWRLHLVDLARCDVRAALVFPLKKGKFPPAFIAVDGEGNFRLASLASVGTPGSLIVVSPEGLETARQDLTLGSEGLLTGLIWQDGLIACTGDGLWRLAPASADDWGGQVAQATFVTPTLRSPPATPTGWNRADLAIDLPVGARLTATIHASVDPDIAARFDALMADPAIPAASRVERIEKLFSSPAVERREPGQVYEGAGGEQNLHLLLDRIAAPWLWLRFDLVCPVGTAPALLRRLEVRYPERSWLADLPAIYSDEPGPAAQLRQFLAPFEAVYGEIDEAIDQLPARIHPDTAPDADLGWLLGWLGFPPTTGLSPQVQRRLLKAAGGLLERRGTLGALRELLSIVTGAPVEIGDAAQAALWVIGVRPARFAPQLGRTTRLAASLPGGFRPGSGMRLGEEPLGPLCTDIGRTLGADCGLVTIRIALDPAMQDVVRPIVDSLLAMFVPAHCRIDLRIVPSGRTPLGGRLDSGWLLAGADDVPGNGTAGLDDPCTIELGSEARLGAWHLPATVPPPFTLDGQAAPGGARRLA